MTGLLHSLSLIAFASLPATPVLAQSPPTVPTTKILAISHAVGNQPSREQFAAILQREVRSTVGAYLDGKIDQWYFRTDGKGVVFVVNATSVDDAKAVLEQFPLGKAGLMAFDYIPLGPLGPLRLLANTPVPGQ
jgi:hypothetical protein